MKERPILFSGAMVRAILEGKTQTRRVVNPQPSDSFAAESWGEVHLMRDGDFPLRNGSPIVIGWGPSNGYGDEAHVCKYGKPGDRLWVKETFCNAALEGYSPVYLFRADEDLKPDGVPWKPSIFCPRTVSRLTLELTAVRVERVQDISEGDAWAEGCKRGEPTDNGGFFPAQEPDPSGVGERGWDCAVDWYADLWDSINAERAGGKFSWASNPWVWVLEFKDITPEARP